MVYSLSFSMMTYNVWALHQTRPTSRDRRAVGCPVLVRGWYEESRSRGQRVTGSRLCWPILLQRRRHECSVLCGRGGVTARPQGGFPQQAKHLGNLVTFFSRLFPTPSFWITAIFEHWTPWSRLGRWIYDREVGVRLPAGSLSSGYYLDGWLSADR